MAVTKFQKAAGLPADGVVGSETWNRLLPPSPTVTASPTTNTAAPPSKPTTSFPIPSSQASTSAPAKPATSATPAKSTATKSPTSESAAKQELIALPILRVGTQGSAVTGLQERLRALGYLKSSADGVFGAETQAAVKAAQKRFSLEPDGVVGTGTWLVLMR
ncbi:peptidoglycan-binding protein [Phormidium sp. CLA17]|nr:peptidoglycan-binding protein [Leptolyngbya sp. Cla-17]